MDCPRPIKSVLCQFYATWSSRTRPSMRIQRSEGLGSRLRHWYRRSNNSVNFNPDNDLQTLVIAEMADAYAEMLRTAEIESDPVLFSIVIGATEVQGLVI